MKIVVPPLLAEAAGFADAMNRLQFGMACLFALSALLLSFLPQRWRVLRWASISCALVSISLVVYLSIPSVNDPPYQPTSVRALPVLMALLAIALSLRTLIKNDAA
jgi:peptidoglycan/LPS O-acetylase OafA/YrhL